MFYHREGCYTKVVVFERDLTDFNGLMKKLRDDGIGRDEGFFLIELHESVKNTTNIPELIDYVNKYFQEVFRESLKHSTSSQRGKTMSKLHRKDNTLLKEIPVQVQQFFYGSEAHDIYGYKKLHCPLKAAKLFLHKVMAALLSSESNESKDAVGEVELSNEEVLKEYWSAIRQNAVQSAGMITPKKINKSAIIRRGELNRKRFLPSLRQSTSESLSPSTSSICHDARPNGKEDVGNAPQEPILYGAGIPVEGHSFLICQGFSLSTLGTIIDVHRKKIPGIHFPYLYLGDKNSTFVWHIEDQVLLSISYLHGGARKVWFIVPPAYYDVLANLVRSFSLDLCHLCCVNILGHKYLVISPEVLQRLGIPVITVFQRPRQFMVLLPYTAHAGFNEGPNLAEAVNFGDDEWVDLGVHAPKCDCFPDTQIHLDMTDIIAVSRPHLLDAYLSRDVFQMLEAFPQKRTQVMLYAAKNCQVRGLEDVNHFAESSELHVSSDGCNENDAVVDPSCDKSDTEEENYKFLGARVTIECPEPMCDKVFKNQGRSKLPRLLKHIQRHHAQSCPKLIDKVHQMYPPKPKPTKNCIKCPECGEIRSGNRFHLRLHYSRKHKNVAFENAVLME